MTCQKHSQRSGFTLVELSISIIVIAFIVSTVFMTQNQKARTDNRAALNRKLDMIGEALYKYRMVNSKLPCPGNSSLARSNTKFGEAADPATPGECNNGATVSSNVNSTGNNVFGGSVPVRTLGLPDDAAYDPWGNAFTYYVDAQTTIAANWTTAQGTFGVTNTNELQVEDESTATFEDIFAVVMSHGPNGHGGFNIAGNRINAGVTNPAEWENCMCNASAAAVGDVTRIIRIQRTLPTSALDIKTNFDDVARFYPKSYFYTYSEKSR